MKQYQRTMAMLDMLITIVASDLSTTCVFAVTGRRLIKSTRPRYGESEQKTPEVPITRSRGVMRQEVDRRPKLMRRLA